VADVRTVNWVPGRCLRTRLAGAFLFVPLLARLRFDALVQHAGYPGSTRVPAPAALLSLLALKLLDKERRSHVNDFSFDEALGLFAGLNVLPKKSFLTEYSYRTGLSIMARSFSARSLVGSVNTFATMLGCPAIG
jgi:hypothetical protein